jgi:ATP-dependent DNA helicase RecQ
MIKCLIFDLDGTLVDTSAIDLLRHEKQWREVYQRLKDCTPFAESLELLKSARSLGIKVAVVTNSPSKYAHDLLKYFGLNLDVIVTYHDVTQPKPAPDGIQVVLSKLNISNSEAVFLGDSDDDLAASNASGVEFYCVPWTNNTHLLTPERGLDKLLAQLVTPEDHKRSASGRTELQQQGNHLFLGYYLGALKQEIWRFKDSNPAAIERWSQKLSELTDELPSVDIIVRARGHKEVDSQTTTPSNGLDAIAGLIAEKTTSTYIPEALVKTRELKKSVNCSASERVQQVRGAYQVKRLPQLENLAHSPRFLVVDDVLTSGATTKEIIRAIRDTYPDATVYIFTLVKTLYRSEVTDAGSELALSSKLLSDLYSPLNTSERSKNSLPISTTKRGRLKSKAYTAGYTKTNQNFIFQNLRNYSIASEASSKTSYQACSIIKNILQRGTPTIASRRLRRHFKHSTPFHDELPVALISKERISWRRTIRGDDKTQHYPARKFFEELMERYLGEFGFLKYLTLPEVEISEITQLQVDRLHNQQVDFFIPQVGVIIEIDGPQHKQTAIRDQERDEFNETLGLKTLRFTTEEIATESSSFKEKMEQLLSYAGLIQKLEDEGKISTPNNLTLSHYQAAFGNGVDVSSSTVRLTAAIRFQLLILELVVRGELRFGQQNKVCLINRDEIDFAEVAIVDLNDYFTEIFVLLGEEERRLDIDLIEVSESEIIQEQKGPIIDFSVMLRFDDEFQTSPEKVYARTHYLDFYRRFNHGSSLTIENAIIEPYDFFQISSDEPIEYDLDLGADSRQRKALQYFLSNLFLPYLDAPDFREGQVGIIGSALSRKSTIGLLPTGSGKSICYQLAAILQPAVSFVVCPIKSLMYDQKADLDAIGFSRCNYITSELTADEKQRVQTHFGQGKYFFVLISPERFQTQKFRTEMSAIGMDLNFAYAVIDEVHCLSEWGHDFRTSYLNLANTVELLAPNSTYIGLTATASVNVLKDIQSEFNIPDENIRTPLDFTRPELRFHVIDDGAHKSQEALRVVQHIQFKWMNKADMGGIIFTPTVNGPKGCFELAGFLSNALKKEVHFYSGSKPKGYRSSVAFDEYKQEVQRRFKNSEFELLTATKAFGMGVNKGNIGYTIHFGIPSSMEALYQEAGRAGRDKQLFVEEPADCYVLLTRESNAKLLDAIWEPSLSVPKLKEYVAKLNRASDVNTNLYLMTAGLETINFERQLLVRIYEYLKQNSSLKKVAVRAAQFGVEKPKFEKAIYRLSQLGIVKDWVIEDFFVGSFEVYFKCPTTTELQNALEKTIQKYEPTFQFSELQESTNEFTRTANQWLSAGKISEDEHVFLSLLIWSYDHFVYNRRQSLKTVYEQCCDLSEEKISNDEFKVRLENYFRFNDSTHRLLQLAENAQDMKDWLSVFYDTNGESSAASTLISTEGLFALREQVARYLESYKENPFLNYTSGLVRLLLGQFDDADGERRMSRALEKISSKNFLEIESLIYDTLKLKDLFSDEAKVQYAKVMYKHFPRSQVLVIINQSFSDPFTYSELLKPLAQRLKSVTEKYKEALS